MAKLDEEMLDLTEEKDLEAEIEQADLVRERLTLCIIDIDEAIGRAETISATPRPTTPPVDMPTAATPVGALTPTTPPVHTPTAATPVGALTPTTPTVDTPTAATPVGALTTTTPPVEPPTSEATPSTVTTTSSDVAADTDASAIGACESFINVATPTTVTVSTGTMTPVMATGVIPGVKLPKLTIQKFNGDLTRWAPFWDAFESAIHNNPSLSDVDRFNYLKSYLESTAADSIAGLTLTSANYAEAISTLKKRFGNTQLIVNKHMDGLLSLPTVNSHHDVKCLRRLYDAVESHVRGLRALGVRTESYGGMLISIIMSKSPEELRLIVSREITTDSWEISDVLTTIDKEVTIRERSTASSSGSEVRFKKHKSPQTAATFLNSTPRVNRCVYCNKDHLTSTCDVVKDIQARKDVLRQAGRCYVCLRRNHISRNCRSALKCCKCQGRHHETICQKTVAVQDSSGPSVMYAHAQAPVFLQTARATIEHPNAPTMTARVRALLDRGSQRTYITQGTKEKLNLPVKRTETLRIKTFGSTEKATKKCELVEL